MTVQVASYSSDDYLLAARSIVKVCPGVCNAYYMCVNVQRFLCLCGLAGVALQRADYTLIEILFLRTCMNAF